MIRESCKHMIKQRRERRNIGILHEIGYGYIVQNINPVISSILLYLDEIWMNYDLPSCCSHLNTMPLRNRPVILSEAISEIGNLRFP